MGVDHGRFDVLMPEKFLDRAYIVAAFQQMCRKGMAKRVTGGALGQTRLPDCGCHRFLHDGLMDMMASLLAGFCICPAVLLGKHPLPPPIPWRIGVFAVEGLRQQGSRTWGRILNCAWRDLDLSLPTVDIRRKVTKASAVKWVYHARGSVFEGKDAEGSQYALWVLPDHSAILGSPRYSQTMTTHRIEMNPKVMMGKPVIRGTRIPVELILRKLGEGATEADLLDAYPRLTKADIQAAIGYAADTVAHEETVLIGTSPRKRTKR